MILPRSKQRAMQMRAARATLNLSPQAVRLRGEVDGVHNTAVQFLVARATLLP